MHTSYYVLCIHVKLIYLIYQDHVYKLYIYIMSKHEVFFQISGKDRITFG